MAMTAGWSRISLVCGHSCFLVMDYIKWWPQRRDISLHMEGPHLLHHAPHCGCEHVHCVPEVTSQNTSGTCSSSTPNGDHTLSHKPLVNPLLTHYKDE